MMYKFFSKMPALVGAVLPGFGMQAGKPGAVQPAPALPCQPCSSDFGEKLKQIGVVLETTRARFAGAHLLSPPVSNPS